MYATDKQQRKHYLIKTEAPSTSALKQLISYSPSLVGFVMVSNCPCITSPGNNAPPTYIGNDYYCESGTLYYQANWHTSDPLWDGMQCGGDEEPCCNHTGLPWFNKNTLTPTPLPLSTCVAVWMSQQITRISEQSFWSSMSNDLACHC